MDNQYEIYLRPLKLDDAEISYRWRNDPRVWRYTGSQPDRHVTVEMEREWVRKVLSEESSKRFAICIKGTGRYIGNAYLVNIDWTAKTGEEGIFIGDVSMWGHGIGTAVRNEMLRIVHRDFGIQTVYSDIRSDNIASLKSACKSGFAEMTRDNSWVRMIKKLG